MRLSIVIPIYNSSSNVREVYNELKKVIINFDYEIIYIDDGSTDNTYNLLKELKQEDDNIKIIKFDRNYGQHQAMICGLKNTKGDIIIIMDNDLEIPPYNIIQFINKINEGYEYVSAYRINRKVKFYRRLFSVIFNKIIAYLSKVKLHDFASSMKAIKKEIKQDIIASGNLITFTKKLKNYKVTEIKVKTDIINLSTYNFFKLIRLAFYAISVFIVNKKQKVNYSIEKVIE